MHILPTNLSAKVSVSGVFSDNMVLQRHVPIPIWGWADANEPIQISFHNQVKKIKADKSGKWIVNLDRENAGGPFNLTISGRHNSISYKNILVGEVWLCSGQSNMEWSVAQSNNAKNEIKNSANYPSIRHLNVKNEVSALPVDNLTGHSWEVCQENTVGEFTAVGYFFAKKLYDSLQVPIGIINATWGGTNIETWISRKGFENSEISDFKDLMTQLPASKLSELVSKKSENILNRITKLQQSPIGAQLSDQCMMPAFDDSHWPTLTQPGVWERQSIGEFDGVMWVRKHFQLDDEPKDAILEIPSIDDDDITYINGFKVGSTQGWNIKRRYIVPAKYLKKGDNVIAIRIVDTGGDGGIYGLASTFKITISEMSIALHGDWKWQVESISQLVNPNDYPSLCYHAMIHPLVPFAIKGALWYQGESNVPRAHQYLQSFPLMINTWRNAWNTDFPFYFVQLATFNNYGNSNSGCPWAELRDAQTQTLSVPNTGMVVTTDIGNPTDIHPTDKQSVGSRLASIALHHLYQKPNIYSGPTYKSMERIDNQMVITFENVGDGLMAMDKYGYVKGFEIAGNDKVFHFAKANIKDNKVIIYNENVHQPVAVRFGWMADASECNLFNKNGLPVVPFRTDTWKWSTEGIKYEFAK